VQFTQASLLTPKLLVSVRSAAEARAALEGGVDWLDVKEPVLGSLGRASNSAIKEILGVPRGRVPLSLAAGELREIREPLWEQWRLVIDGVGLVKIGLSNCAGYKSWRCELKDLAANAPQGLRLASVHYADHQQAHSPVWEEIVEVAMEIESPMVLIDTFVKDGRGLLDHVNAEQLYGYRQQLSRLGIGLALAGSLSHEDFPALVQLQPDVIAVRGAVCEKGRESAVVSGKVSSLKKILGQLTESSL
jgi:uncharacterized protein (UPF0264 family)